MKATIKQRIRSGKRKDQRPKKVTIRETINLLASMIVIMLFFYFLIVLIIKILLVSPEIIINIPLIKSCGV